MSNDWHFIHTRQTVTSAKTDSCLSSCDVSIKSSHHESTTTQAVREMSRQLPELQYYVHHHVSVNQRLIDLSLSSDLRIHAVSRIRMICNKQRSSHATDHTASYLVRLSYVHSTGDWQANRCQKHFQCSCRGQGLASRTTSLEISEMSCWLQETILNIPRLQWSQQQCR